MLNDSDNDVDASIKPTQTKFHIKSIGYAAENLKLGETKLEITPIEDLGYLHGEVNADQEEQTESGVDAYGNAYSVKIKTSNSILAEWLPWGSNRITPPNVRRGERILLWQYSDNDKYYWTSTGLDDHLRRLETVIHAFSNTRDEKTEKLDPSNSYYFELSTHNKLITLRTNKSDQENPEPYAYIVQINTKDGNVVITDDINNTFSIESKEKRLKLHNADGSYVEIDKGVCNIFTGSTVNINTGTFNVNATTNINGTTTVNGSTTINGNTSTKGSLTNNGKDVGSSHKHSGVTGGRSNTGTPT